MIIKKKNRISQTIFLVDILEEGGGGLRVIEKGLEKKKESVLIERYCPRRKVEWKVIK